MRRKAIVHIGPMKTGSTSIQHWLFRSAGALDQSGIHVVRAFGPNMSRLSAIAMAKMLGEAPVASDQERLSLARAEIAGLPDTTHTLVISGELLGNQLRKPRQVRALKAILDEFCDDYRIIAYLRRQDELSVSRYSTALRRGDARARRLSRAVDYDAMLTVWSSVFGRAAIVPRIFDRASLVDGDVVRDFADAAGLGFEPINDGAIARNSALRADAQQLLVDLARRAREAGVDEPLADFPRMEEVTRVLDRDFTGRGMQPTRAEVLAYYEGVRASNEAVRRAWFPDRLTLFSEDFSSYPESEPPPASTAELLEVAMTVLVELLVGAEERAGTDQDAKGRRALAGRMRELNRGRGGRRAGSGA